MFCPKCKSIMLPKMEHGKRQLACSCGYRQGGEMKITEGSKAKDDKLAVIEKEETINTIVEAECSKCGLKKAEYWEIQTRSADEPPTRFFKCVACKHTWREYK